MGIILILIDWAFSSIQHMNSLEELTQGACRRHHRQVRCCSVLKCMALQGDQHRTTVSSWWLSEIHNWATKYSELHSPWSRVPVKGMCCPYHVTMKWSPGRDTVSSHLIFLGPPHPCNLHLQFLKDVLACFGMFSSFLFPTMVKIQNGKQLSHTGND